MIIPVYYQIQSDIMMPVYFQIQRLSRAIS